MLMRRRGWIIGGNGEIVGFSLLTNCSVFILFFSESLFLFVSCDCAEGE
jgi:hypothetical protein